MGAFAMNHSMVLGPSEHRVCDLLCFNNTSTEGRLSKDKSSVCVIADFSPGVGGRQKESPQLSQRPQPYEDKKKITAFEKLLKQPPTYGLVFTYIQRLLDVQVNQAHHQLDCDVDGNTFRYGAADLLHSCEKIKSFFLNPEALARISQADPGHVQIC